MGKLYTPLHYAAMSSHQEIVKFLLSKGANPLLGDNNKTAYFYAEKPEIKRLLILAELKEIIKINEEKKSGAIGLFSTIQPDKIKAFKEAVNALITAVDKGMKKEELTQLQKKYPILSKSPLLDYFNKVMNDLVGIDFKAGNVIPRVASTR